MDMWVGILLLITYFLLIYYATRGGNLMIGFLVMAFLWVLIGRIPYDIAISEVFEKSAETYGMTATVVIFGSWFGRVLVETGIAGAIIRRTVELGGDRPLLTTILVSLVTTFIFTSTFGVGAVIAIGVIVLPILLSIGVPKNVAVSSFTLSVGAGMYVNIVLFKQIQLFFPDVAYNGPYIKFGFIAMAIQILFIMLMLTFNLRKGKVNYAWAQPTEPQIDTTNVPAISFIIPIIPVIMAIAFKWQPIPAMLLAIFLALLVTKKFSSWKTAESLIQKTLYDGVADVGLLLGMLFTLAMFGSAAGKNAHIFQTMLSPIMPKNALIIAIAIGMLAPLALFRGPLMAWGAGSATIAILTGLNLFSPQLLLPLIYVSTISMAISTCPTQSWNLWAINYTKLSIKDFLKTGVVWAWLVVIINEIIAVNMFK
ncbi:citrate transporter [Thermoanaerobacter thermohydrosulfuricus]